MAEPGVGWSLRGLVSVTGRARCRCCFHAQGTPKGPSGSFSVTPAESGPFVTLHSPKQTENWTCITRILHSQKSVIGCGRARGLV